MYHFRQGFIPLMVDMRFQLPEGFGLSDGLPKLERDDKTCEF